MPGRQGNHSFGFPGTMRIGTFRSDDSNRFTSCGVRCGVCFRRDTVLALVPRSQCLGGFRLGAAADSLWSQEQCGVESRGALVAVLSLPLG